MIDIFLVAAMHAAAVGVVACLISESRIMAPLRLWLSRTGVRTLWYCPICMGFWLAAPTLKFGLVHYFTVVALSNVWMLIILKVYAELDALASQEGE